jgi:hypothetical protein
MIIVLGILYTLLFCFIIVKSRFAAKTNLPKSVLITAFIIKIVAAFAYGYIHYTSRHGAQSDTWKLFYQSQLETALLFKNPFLFLQSIFGNGYQQSANDILSTTNNYWNDLKHNILLFIMSICNVFTKSNYYVNTILFNFLTFWGSIALYRFIINELLIPQKIVIALVFFLPTLVFWSSGFHKEGILFAALAFILFALQRCLSNKIQIRYILIIILALFFIFILRNYLLLFLVPFLVVWAFVYKTKMKHIGYIYVAACVLFICFFLFSNQLLSAINLLQITSTVQHEFLQLPANTTMQVPHLNATTTAFVNYLPLALQTAFIEPFTQLKGINMLPSLFENLLILFVLLFVLFNKKYWTLSNGAYLLICFSFFTLLFLGYTIPIIGAIIRYKAIVTPFLILGLLGTLNWKTNLGKQLN